MTEESVETPATVTHERMIATALNNVMKEVRYVQKGGKVSFGSTNYTYVSESNILSDARPSMVKHGLTFLPSCEEMNVSGKMVFVKMSYTLTHTSGAVWPKPLYMWGSGQDSGDKAIYKAITGANKYMMLKLLNIPSGDDPEAGVQPEETVYEKPDKDVVLAHIMKEYPGATEEARSCRLATLNAWLLGIESDAVEHPSQVTEEIWSTLKKGMK